MKYLIKHKLFPLYLLVEGDGVKETADFMIQENSCPINYYNFAKMIIDLSSDEPTDPHGCFEVVRTVDTDNVDTLEEELENLDKDDLIKWIDNSK